MTEQSEEKPAKRKPRKLPPIGAPDASIDTRGKLSRFQRYEFRRISRTEIKLAQYNPRFITPAARKLLDANLKRRGLLQAVTWNEITGNLVAGHQKLALIDLAEGHGEYLLDVCVVRLTEEEEREQNVFMNNPAAQGTWDIEALGQLGFKSGDFDWERAGFDRIALEEVFAGTQYEREMQSLFDIANQSSSAQQAMSDLEAMGAVKPEPPPPTERGNGSTTHVGETVTDKKPGSKSIDAFRSQEQDIAQRKADEKDTEVFIVVLLPTRRHRLAITRKCGLPDGERYLTIETLAATFGFETPPPVPLPDEANAG